MKKNYKWIIWFPKKWNKNLSSGGPAVYYGYLDGEIFMTSKFIYNDIENKSKGYQPIDENFKNEYHYEFFDSVKDVVMISKELQNEQYQIERDYDKMKNFHIKLENSNQIKLKINENR